MMRKQRPSSERCMSHIYTGSMTENRQLKQTCTDTTSNRLKLYCVPRRNNGGPTEQRSCRRQRIKKAKLFYDGLKAIYGPQANCSSSIFSADAETRLTEPSRIRERWAEHFSDMLNWPSTISQAAIDNIAHRPLMDELAYRLTLDETTAAIKKLSSGKAAGPDALDAEIYKYGCINLTKSLVKLFNDIWDSRAVPQEFIVHIYKRKGDKSICDNHRGISLLCIAGENTHAHPAEPAFSTPR